MLATVNKKNGPVESQASSWALEDRKWVRGCGGAVGFDEGEVDDDGIIDDEEDEGAVLAPSCAAARRCAIAGGGVARAAALCRNEEEGSEGFMNFGAGQRLPYILRAIHAALKCNWEPEKMAWRMDGGHRGLGRELFATPVNFVEKLRGICFTSLTYFFFPVWLHFQMMPDELKITKFLQNLTSWTWRVNTRSGMLKQ